MDCKLSFFSLKKYQENSKNCIWKLQYSQNELRNNFRRKKYAVNCSVNNNEGDKGFRILERTGGLISQGTLVKGVKSGWKLAWQIMMKELAPQSTKGEYKRPGYDFQAQIGEDPRFPVEAGRYHVYVGNACPWCHKVLLALAITGAADKMISYSKLQDDAERASRGGWVFDERDPIFGAKDLRQVYDSCQPGFTGRCTAPLLVDRKTRSIVCNESSIIVKNIASLDFEGATGIQLYPPSLLTDTQQMEDKIYNGVNNAVYRSGFATSQQAYDDAQKDLYQALEYLDEILSKNKFIVGDKLTAVDLQLYPTVARFDQAYAVLFKCSSKRISDYPNIARWFGKMYNLDVPQSTLQVKDTFDFDDARRSYFQQLFPLNPGGIIPSGPTFTDLKNKYLIPTEEDKAIFHLKTTVAEVGV
eukprot:TRINITY_DN53501_c0_g1_i12.p1 TRINITY_DN53501_c0_g1~~TRINITY_DN53501_c0_g1_i12.p1  ORF type:complete len:415 (-),score=38.34 TRINITY_DN53501_c0_g1_i12:610-1854(-)